MVLHISSRPARWLTLRFTRVDESAATVARLCEDRWSYSSEPRDTLRGTGDVRRSEYPWRQAGPADPDAESERPPRLAEKTAWDA